MLYDEIVFKNPGVLRTKLSPDLFNQIKADALADAEKKIPYNEHLVGQIKGEYEIKVRPYFESMINKMWIEYRDRFDFHVLDQYYIPDYAWINVQNKHEFNPVHHHDGAASWVIWLQIPYELEQELNTFNNAKSRDASLFNFYYNSLTGTQDNHTLHIDKEWEGTMIMFPAMLKHSVHPFYTTDVPRISIAGNIDVHARY
jgi:hypothetical protein